MDPDLSWPKRHRLRGWGTDCFQQRGNGKKKKFCLTPVFFTLCFAFFLTKQEFSAQKMKSYMLLISANKSEYSILQPCKKQYMFIQDDAVFLELECSVKKNKLFSETLHLVKYIVNKAPKQWPMSSRKSNSETVMNPRNGRKIGRTEIMKTSTACTTSLRNLT
jgi:hypothetical protein